MAEPTTTPVDSHRSTNVNQALDAFQFVSNPYLRRAIYLYPLLFLVVSLADAFLFGGLASATQVYRVSSYLAIIVATIFFLPLFDAVPRTLRLLSSRQVLQAKAGTASFEESYTDFVTEFHAQLNRPWVWALGIFAAALRFIAPFVLEAFRVNDFAGANVGDIGLRLLWASASVFLLAVALWRLIVTGYMVSRISQRFAVVVQRAHPDQSGGLQPLGDLCFRCALVFIGPAFFLVGWLIVFSIPDLASKLPPTIPSGDKILPALILGLIVELAAVIAVFLLPLLGVHKEMSKQKDRHMEFLGEFAQRIQNINNNLLHAAGQTNPAEIQKNLDTLKGMRQVYEESKTFPVWPFGRRIALTITVSQIVAFLSTLGVSQPITNLIQNVLKVILP